MVPLGEHAVKNREEIERMQAAIQDNLVCSIETHGTCVAVDGTGEEHSHKWHNGETRVAKFEDSTGEEIEYVFAVRVELVSVERR